MAQLTNYKYSDVQTDIERFEGDEFCVIIKWDGESKTIETYQRGYKDSLYSGEGMEAARESTGLSQEDWDSLISVDVQYMEEPNEATYDFETLSDAEEWAHRTSLVFDTDEECQEECERLLKTVTVRERDE